MPAWRLFRAVATMSRWERIALAAFTGLFALSLTILLRTFYVRSTVVSAAVGGTYIEGSVGQLQPLNPWFTVQNDVNRDIVSLVFSGLLRYNPDRGIIEPDLATMEVSPDKRLYTLKLRPGLFWHDSTLAQQQPVTADDVLFTFQTIQHPDFPNPLLQQNFRGVTLEKLDNRTVRFRLEQPYTFFPSNLTLGLLPKHALGAVPVSALKQELEFGFQPIGAGPYRLKSIVETDLSTEVMLERFPRILPPPYRLERVVFRVFPDYSTLLSDLHNLSGIRSVPRGGDGKILLPRRFEAASYTLPQYVAVFLNLDRTVMRDRKLRLGLQLGTDKQAISQAVHEDRIVDTPLLELASADWQYKFDPLAAQGALHESRWFVPERLRIQALQEQADANATGVIRGSPVVLLHTGATLTLSGGYAGADRALRLNAIPLVTQAANTGAWVVTLGTSTASGGLRPGVNLLRLTTEDGQTVDSFYLFRATDTGAYARALEEQRLLRRFLATKDAPKPGDRLTVDRMILDQSFLRERRSEDPVSVRVNDRGEPLRIRLLTSKSPPQYARVAEMIRKQWQALGAEVTVEVAQTPEDFERRLLSRDYDALLFGQSLLDNLDSYPYWHSSGVQRVTGQETDLRRDAYNLSQYASVRADSLLGIIRTTADEAARKNALSDLREVLKQDVPAIFLYSPLYTYAHHQDIRGVELGKLSLHSDRFLGLNRWYVKEERVFKPGRSWWSFFRWLVRQD